MALKSFDEDENIFSNTPNIIKYPNESLDEEEDSKKEIDDFTETSANKKVKKNGRVPSNITCHCSGNFVIFGLCTLILILQNV